jgi:hypothetical protein
MSDDPDKATAAMSGEGAGIKCVVCGARPFPVFASDSPDARVDFGLMKVGGQLLCSLCQDQRATALQSASEEVRMTTLAFDPLAALKRATRDGGPGRVERIPVHPAAAMLPMMSDAEIDELAADIKENGLVEPVVFWCDNTAQKESGQLWGLEHCPRYLLDGRSRAAALERIGHSLDGVRRRTKEPQSPVRLLPAWRRAPRTGAWTYLDPWAYVLSANVRRRHLTPEQRRRVVEDMVRRRPELTDRALAKLALAHHETVAARRAEAEACGDIRHIPPAERVEADGRRSRARKTPVEPADCDVPPDWRPLAGFRFLSPVKPDAPRLARIVAARAYVNWLGLTVDELTEPPS